MIKKKNYLVALFVATAALFTACSDDDDGTPPVISPTGSIMVEDQTLMDGTLTINNVVLSEDGWVVLYEDNAGAQGTEILGSKFLEANTYTNVTVDLDENVELTTGQTVWAALHVDADGDGVLDWDGTTGTDVPIRTGTVNVSESFVVTVESNPVTAADQAVVDGTITIDYVNLEGAGWVVVHANDDGAPGEVVGISEVLTAGSHNNVTVTFNDSADVSVGDMLWIMLHSDTGVAGEYEFDGGDNGLDLPVIGDDGNPVMISITITE